MKEHIIQPVSRYFSEKSDFQCEHGVPFDSECGECIEDKKIVDAGKMRSLTIQKVNCKEKIDSSHNNGGKTDYYDLPSDAKCCQDIIEWREMNFQQGNIFKVAFTFNCGRQRLILHSQRVRSASY